jgi:hypothetical protein
MGTKPTWLFALNLDLILAQALRDWELGIVYQKSKGLKPYFVPLRANACKWRVRGSVS